LAPAALKSLIKTGTSACMRFFIISNKFFAKYRSFKKI
jgi:hypothetical protein